MGDDSRIEKQPQLYDDTDNPDLREQISALDVDINANPDLYLAAAATAGHLSLSLLIEQVPAPRLKELEPSIPEQAERLRALGQAGLMDIVMLDRGTEWEIFDDTSVNDVSRALKSAQLGNVTSFAREVSTPPTAEDLQTHLGMLKLFIYIRRVKKWKAQEQAEQRSAAPVQTTPHASDITRQAKIS